MKLKARTFQIFFELHAWVSVLAALSLYVIFLAGAFALFHAELDAWASTPTDYRDLPRLQPLIEQLLHDQAAPAIDRLSFSIERTGLRAMLQRGAQICSYVFMPSSRRLVPARSELGSFLYELHYFGPIPNGIYVAGLSALLFGLAIVSGLIVHWKGLVAHWFRFRPELSVRKWTGDLHKALGLFGVPFQLVFAWSGAMLCLAAVSVEPAVERALFHGRESIAAVRGEASSSALLTGRPLARIASIDGLLARSRREIPGLAPTWIAVDQLADEAAIVRVYGDVPTIAFGRGDVMFRARDGVMLHASDPRRSNVFVRFECWLYGLHFARFGGYAIKWMYALLALATCAVIVTGNVVWLERRDRQRRRFGNRVLERLTVGCCAGLPLAIAALFVANCVLADTITDRSAIETRIFGASWICALLLPFAWRNVRSNVIAMLLATSAGFAFVAIFDALRPLLAIDSLRAKVDAVLLVLALLSVLAAALARSRATTVATTLPRRATRPRVQTPPRSPRRSADEAG